MKTLLEIATECGAGVSSRAALMANEAFIAFKNEAQLQATIDAWNAQNYKEIASKTNLAKSESQIDQIFDILEERGLLGNYERTRLTNQKDEG